jgi:hypothetical protein
MDVIGTATAAGFRLASRLRGSKAFHPAGVVHEAVVEIAGGEDAPPGVGILATPARHQALIRFSRGAGLPAPLPDVMGMAIRLPDVHGPGRHQDLLLVTSGDGPVLHHLLVPAPGFLSLPYSSLLPYRAADRGLFVVGATVRERHRPAPGSDEYDGLARAAATGEPAFDLAVAGLGGRLRPVGTITLGSRLDRAANALRFNPFNTGGGLQPSGFLHRLRDAAYPGSQAGWAGVPAEALSAR